MTVRAFGCLAAIIVAACYEDDVTVPMLEGPRAILVAGPRSVMVGDTITLFAAVWENGTRVASPYVTWKSSQSSFATVSGGPDTCAVYGVSAGSVTISAWVNDIADSVSIAVIAATGP